MVLCFLFLIFYYHNQQHNTTKHYYFVKFVKSTWSLLFVGSQISGRYAWRNIVNVFIIRYRMNRFFDPSSIDVHGQSPFCCSNSFGDFLSSTDLLFQYFSLSPLFTPFICSLDLALYQVLLLKWNNQFRRSEFITSLVGQSTFSYSKRSFI